MDPFHTRYVLRSVLVVLLGLSIPYGWQFWQYYYHESTDNAYVVSDIVLMSLQVNGTVLAAHAVEHQKTCSLETYIQQADASWHGIDYPIAAMPDSGLKRYYSHFPGVAFKTEFR